VRTRQKWLKSMLSWREGLLFDHLYKNGGSSIAKVLATMVGVQHVSPLAIVSYQNALSLYPDKKVITGHFHFLPGDVLDASRYHLTMLRHPVDRVLSHYYFVRNNIQAGHNAVADLAKEKPLEEFLESTDAAAIKFTANGQTRHFMALLWDGHAELATAQQLGLAKQALEQYDVVGVFPMLDEFVEVLCADLGLLFDQPMPHINVTKNRPPENAIPKSALARIESMNSADIELFDHARELFLKKRKATWRRLIMLVDATPGNPASGTELVKSSPVPSREPQAGPAEFGNRRIEIVNVKVRGQITQTEDVYVGDFVELAVEFAASETADDLTLGFMIRKLNGHLVYASNTRHMGYRIGVTATGNHVAKLIFLNTLGIGGYSVTVALHTGHSHTELCYHWKEAAALFRVVRLMGNHFDGQLALFPRLSVTRIDGQGTVSVPLDCAAMTLFRLIKSETPLSSFGASIECRVPPERLRVGEIVRISLMVRNTSDQTWLVSGRYPLCVSYHWIDDATGEVVVFDGLRTGITSHVDPGETVSIGAVVAAPTGPGRYTLELTLVQEFVAWFDSRGAEPLRLHVQVIPQ